MLNDKKLEHKIAGIVRGIMARHGGFEPHKHEQHVAISVAQIMDAISEDAIAEIGTPEYEANYWKTRYLLLKSRKDTFAVIEDL